MCCLGAGVAGAAGPALCSTPHHQEGQAEAGHCSSGTCVVAEVLDFTPEENAKLQNVENSVYGAVLQLPAYAANGALRGDVRASSCYARDFHKTLIC